MEKLMYLVWLAPGTPRHQVRPRLLDQAAPALAAAGVRGLTMDLDDEEADVPSPVPPPAGEHTPQAVVSFWLDAVDHRGPAEAALGAVAHRLAGYQVVESLYADYGQSPWAGPRTWPDGQRSPGLLTVALFTARPGLDDATFYGRWFGRQSPLSEAMQPRCRYVRNAVLRACTPGAPPWRGIVEEAWPSAEVLGDPDRFFGAGGDPERLAANQAAMVASVDSFMDLGGLRSLTMSEWILSS